MESEVIGEAFCVMSVYDHRDQPAYGRFGADPAYSANPYILKWWTAAHDQLLSSEIKKKQWAWPWRIKDEILAISSPEVIDVWRTEDPICSKYAWYNVLMYFAISRADKLGLTKAIRAPEWRRCPLCDENFVEDSLPVPLIERLGTNQIDFWKRRSIKGRDHKLPTGSGRSLETNPSAGLWRRNVRLTRYEHG
jgi:hypothetical protein